MPVIVPILHGARLVIQDVATLFVPGATSISTWIAIGGALKLGGIIAESIGPAIAETFVGPDNEIRETRIDTRSVDQILEDIRLELAAADLARQNAVAAIRIDNSNIGQIPNPNNLVHMPFQQVGNVHIDP